MNPRKQAETAGKSAPHKGHHKKPNSHVAHHVPGRMRVKIADAKGNPALLEQISRTLCSVAGVEQVKTNAETGSIVLHYSEDLHPEIHDHLHEHLSQHLSHQPPVSEVDQLAENLEKEAEFLASHSTLARMLVDGARELDLQLKLATGNNLDLKVVIPLGLAAIAMVEIGVHAATPVWVTLGLFSLNHFVEMHAHDLDAVEPIR